MTEYATKEELRQLRQSADVLLNLIGAALRAATSETRPTIDDVQTLLRRASSDMLDPHLQMTARKESEMVLR